MGEEGLGPTLWLAPGPREVPAGDVLVVVDLSWTPPTADGGPRSLRDAAGRVLARVDPIETTARLLDDWAASSGVVEALTVGSTSFWYRVRLSHWLWLQEHVLWAELVRELIEEHRPRSLACALGIEESLRRVASLMAAAHELPLIVEVPPLGTPASGWAARAARARLASSEAIGAVTARVSAPARRVRGGLRRLLAALPRPRTGSAGGTRDAEPWTIRLRRLSMGDHRPLLVVLTQLPHRIETASGPRVMHPNLGPVVDRLRGTSLDPIVIDRYPNLARGGEGRDRSLPMAMLPSLAAGPDSAAAARARAAIAPISSTRARVAIAGVDLGPALAQRVADDAARWLASTGTAVERWRRLAQRLRARAILVADEYHRQDCLEAGAQLGIPVAAVQHGTIYRRHNGYIHRDRPPQLRLPDRTYVFGRWERDLLVRGSVYRDEEVVVGGSPRLDLFEPARFDREAVRRELGVQPGERLLVLSGTYGPLYRRAYYPLLLARLFDRPMPGLRLVVKQHPAEQDEGPYRAVIEGAAAAGGFEPPAIGIVRDIDLYQVLAAADAHLGIHSTVLTEAVFVGTPNLLATGILGGDLLDYVASGVAIPVSNGAELLAGLEAAASGTMTREARAAFIAAHFEPGEASARIAEDLLSWLA